MFRRLIGVLWVAFLVALVLGTFAACGDDDDDDDDNNDDSGGDDDDDGGDCGGYDVVIDGETQFAGAPNAWNAALNIDSATGAITGQVAPDDPAQPPYEVTGFRHDATTGELDGAFPTPAEWSVQCNEALLFNHIDFTVIEGALDGDVTFYCGTVAPENAIGPFNATGTVTCGDFAG